MIILILTIIILLLALILLNKLRKPKHPLAVPSDQKTDAERIDEQKDSHTDIDRRIVAAISAAAVAVIGDIRIKSIKKITHKEEL